ncbi:MAG: DUF1501 domain-containing protein [Bdellovibrionales bacterium]|nr:DUF1501 domain-containing protein [Bdellovibrionales bacterium]
MITRRNLLNASASLLGMTVLTDLVPGLQLFARAQAAMNGKKFFILVQASGGMDVTLGLDPYVMPEGCDSKDMFIEYTPEEILRSDLAPKIRLGPAASPLLPYASRLTIFNGVLMNDTDNGHTANLGYISTGNGEGKNSSLAVEFAIAQGLKPYGVLFEGSVQVGSRASPVTKATELLTGEAANSADLLAYFMQGQSPSEYTQAVKSIVDAKPAMAGFQKTLELLKTSGQMKSVHAIAAAFSAGLSNSAQLDLNASLDTHSNHERSHLTAQKSAWTQVAEIAKVLTAVPYGPHGNSLLDHTTVMVVSDFSRTPFLNPSKGKDHNPQTNSVLLLGGGSTKLSGTVVGSSMLVNRSRSGIGEARHIAAPYNFATQAPARSRAEAESKNVDYIYPENVAATVAELIGINRSELKALDPKTSVLLS